MQSREAGRPTIAQHVVLGSKHTKGMSPRSGRLKRFEGSAVRFTDWEQSCSLIPALTCWAIINRRLRRLKPESSEAQSGGPSVGGVIQFTKPRPSVFRKALRSQYFHLTRYIEPCLYRLCPRAHTLTHKRRRLRR